MYSSSNIIHTNCLFTALSLSLLYSYFASNSGSNSPLPRRSASPIVMAATNASSSTNPSSVAPTRATTNGYVPIIPPSMTNGGGPSNANYPPPRFSNAGGHYNGRDVPPRGHMARSASPSFQNQQVGVARGVSVPPPLQTKGRYSCPRCERKFEHKKDCNDHKTRCMV